MITIGITGNIGSGKSFISQLLRNMGYTVFDADKAGHRVLDRLDVIKEISTRYGDKVIDSDGNLIRKEIGKIVFSDKSELAWLNQLTHPKILEEFEKWGKNQGEKAVFMEAAILFESGFDKHIDHSILVDAPLELRINRIVQRDNVSKEDVLARIANQSDSAILRKKADFIIENDEKQLLLPQIQKIIEQLGL